MSKLEKLSILGSSWDAASGTYHVTSHHALTQAAGYLKYALSAAGPVYFRGQNDKYPSMLPSLHRGATSLTRLRKRENDFGAFRNRVRRADAFIKGTPDYAHDPLLQHYGIKTAWLDVVDNIWVALWFACHQATPMGDRNEYLYYERRRPIPGAFAYVALMQTGALTPVVDSPGLSRSTDLEIIDLRTAAPSLYLRPHAQHGLLIRRINATTLAEYDLTPHIVGWIRISLADALDWMGDGYLLTVHSLFPPPHYDTGIRAFLGNVPKDGPVLLGGIQHIGA